MKEQLPLFLGQNLKFLRKKFKLTQRALAKTLGINRENIESYENRKIKPQTAVQFRMASYFRVALSDLLYSDLSDQVGPNVPDSSPEPRQADRPGRLIEFYNGPIAAGGTPGYPDDLDQDSDYLLPIPAKYLSNGEHKAFEIKGQSMLPITDGTVMIAEKVNRLSDLKDGLAYIIKTHRDGLVYKRVFLKETDAGRELDLVSDNKAFAPYRMHSEDVEEIWKPKMFLSQEMP